MNPSLLNIIWLSVQSAYVFSYLSYAVSYLTSFAVASVMDIDIDIKLYIQNIYDLCDGPGGGGWALQCNKCLCWPTLCNCASISQQTRVRRQPRHGALHVAAAGGGVAAPAHTPAACLSLCSVLLDCTVERRQLSSWLSKVPTKFRGNFHNIRRRRLASKCLLLIESTP